MILALSVLLLLTSSSRFHNCATPASSASAAFTLTSGSTPVSAQSVFEKGLIVFVS